MHTSRRVLAVVFVFALAAAACSGGSETATSTPPITPIPLAASPDAPEDLSDLLESPEAVSTTVTASAFDRTAAEEFVSDLLVGYFEATAARDWDAVYEASSSDFHAACTVEDFAAVTDFEFDSETVSFDGDFEVSVIGDFATGRIDVTDGGGTLPVEGLLAVAEDDGWRVMMNPCDVAARIASGSFSYPIIITTTTQAPPPEPSTAADGSGETASVEAPIDPDITLPDTSGTGDAVTTTTVPDILGPPPIGGTTTTTTTLPPVPLTAAEKVEIEAVIKQFITAEAGRNYEDLHAAVPPLFSCTPADTAAALAAFPWSPTAVTFGSFEMERGNVDQGDEAFATFDVTYVDSGETLTITDFGAWEWGGQWYAAVHPCKWTDNAVEDGGQNLKAVTFMEEVLLTARALYDGAGDYDVPTSTLNAIFIDDDLQFVATPDQAGVGIFAYVNNDQEVLILTQSESEHWYCIVENATTGAHYGASFLPGTIDTVDGCLSVDLTTPWSVL